MLTVGSLFAGIGGFDLAAEWAGMEVVWCVEHNEYCQSQLKRNFPNAKIYGDIRKIEYKELEPVDVILASPPCQPHSVAGKRKGKDDDRYLWPETIAIIDALKPAWIVTETVAGFVSMELDEVLSQMESIGYACQPLIIPACGVNAPHRRDRCWIVAYNEKRTNRQHNTESKERQKPKPGNCISETVVADTKAERRRERRLSVGEKKEISETGIAHQNVLDTAIERLPDWAGGEIRQPEPLTKSKRRNGRKTKL